MLNARYTSISSTLKPTVYRTMCDHSRPSTVCDHSAPCVSLYDHCIPHRVWSFTPIYRVWSFCTVRDHCMIIVYCIPHRVRSFTPIYHVWSFRTVCDHCMIIVYRTVCDHSNPSTCVSAVLQQIQLWGLEREAAVYGCCTGAFQLFSPVSMNALLCACVCVRVWVYAWAHVCAYSSCVCLCVTPTQQKVSPVIFCKMNVQSIALHLYSM
jgi:hypothetical protein